MELFDKNERYTEESIYLSNDVEMALRPIIEKYIKMGFKTREIEYVVARAATDIALEILITTKDQK